MDVRYVCPKDVKKMLLRQARSICWKKWAAKHEYEELVEGGSLAGAGSGIDAQKDEGILD